MKYIRSRFIDPGMVTATPLYNECGRMLLAANAHITAAMCRRIQSLGFHGIFVLDHNDAAFQPLLDDATRLEAIRSLKSLSIDQVMYVANAVVNQILYASGAVYDLDAVCDYDTMTYMHSVNVAVLSVMMGVSMSYGNKKLEHLAQAALLHDIGKTCVDPAIIKGAHRLSDEEFAQVRRHPDHGYAILAKTDMVDKSVMLAVRHHHENEDGTGYPCRLTSAQIPEMAKIIHVADVYDAMVSRRSYKKSMNPADALEYIMSETGTMFDRACVESLKNNIAMYPVGSEVRLSNGMTAWVQENRRTYPSRPVLRTSSGIRIDLMQRLNLTITGFADENPAYAAVSVPA